MERARAGSRVLDRSKAFYVQIWLWSGWGGSNLLFHLIVGEGDAGADNLVALENHIAMSLKKRQRGD